MARVNSEKYFQRQLTDNKKEENLSSSNCTLVENMRDQPKATCLVYSPRRPGKAVENAGETLNKSTKVTTTSDDSSPSKIPLFFHGRQERKSLQILQPSVDGQKLLVGGRTSRKTKNKKHVKESSQSRLKQVKLHLPTSSNKTDSLSSSSDLENGVTNNKTSSEVQTSSDEAYSLMVQDRAPEKYWELVAEERRKALEETLEENIKLYEMIEKLKAENKALREKANDTDYYATMYKIVKEDISPPEENQDV